ncbi:hypothetical protein ACH5RR_030887 [Cinchona calisaya]|uniref:WW domain-containing protein n=1 Tax=Cinchona calisaya TaxID=153742 RepID=A0ABD2YX21_9GENT
MTAPNITESIERSLQNCSLKNHQESSNSDEGLGRSSTSDSTENVVHLPNNTLELNSEIQLPYCWEQCLDLKTGEVYYINWRTGMKSKDDPRTTNPGMNMIDGGLLSSEEEEEEEEDDDDSSYESEEGSSTEESYPSTSRRQQCRRCSPPPPPPPSAANDQPPQQVLVVAGCKSCFMYFMVPRQVQDCPKCFGQLLHFDRSQNASP